MNVEQFKTEINNQIKSLRKQQDQAINTGNYTVLSNCANQLLGINFVMNRLKDLELKQPVKKE